MSFYRIKHPWDPQYALPSSVLAEPAGRGTVTTRGLPRGSMDMPRRLPRAGYAVPGAVLMETPGRGVYGAGGLPRRFVDTKAPDAFDAPRESTLATVRGSLSGTVFSSTTLSRPTVGRRRRRRPFGGDLGSFDSLGDTIDNWVGADVVLFGVKFRVSRGVKYPAPKEKWPYIGRAGGVLGNGRGASAIVPKNKVPKELFKIINDKLGAEVKRLAASDKALLGNPRGLLTKAKQNLGLIGPSTKATALMKFLGNMPLASFVKQWPAHLILGKVDEVKGIEVYGKHWTIDVEEVNRGTGYKLTIYIVPNTSTLGKIGNVIAKPFELVGTGIVAVVDVAKAGVEAALDGLAKLAELACKAAQNEVGQLVGTAAAAGAGANPQSVATGNEIVQRVCAGPQPSTPPPMAAQGGTNWLPIAAVGAGALLLIVAVTR